AILSTSGTQANRILKQHHVDREAVRSQLLSVMAFSETAPVVTGNLPLSPKVQRVINSAVVMSRSLREQKVSSRVILLAVMDEPNTPFQSALRSAGVDVEELTRALAEKPAESEA
ncbi:MAG: Clp protease N-terminal domain-containing protein, partial [Tepidisphaeraceae bacterium]